MIKKYSLIKNSLGYTEIDPKPSIEELQKHYSKKYYQNNHSSYQSTYTDDEIKYFIVESELSLRTLRRYSLVAENRLLDLGCGEGFFANHFKKSGWEVKCVDFSSDGLMRHNPSLISNFVQGNLLNYLEVLDSNIDNFGLINLDNVLEHVVDPIALLRLIKSKIKSSTIVRIEVPNDFSKFQSLLVERGCTEETWVCPPEHISYFNKTSLSALLEAEGFKLISLQTDFPIEQFLLNNHSNYWKNRSLGKEAHFTRVVVTNYLADINIDRMIDYREAAADLEFGRQLTAYVALNL